MSRPLLLDLFCKAGGAAKGYHDAGFDVIGVDVEKQPHYPYEFFRADVLTMGKQLLSIYEFDAIHASPPCQGFSKLTPKIHREKYPNVLPQTRDLLNSSGLPYVIENVEGAPLESATMLCGSMSLFNLTCDYGQLRRHRFFESNMLLSAPGPCRHTMPTVGIYGHPGGTDRRTGKTLASMKDWSDAMGVDWMTTREMAQAIPPAYTEYIGKQLVGVRA